MVQSTEFQRADLVVAQVPKDRNSTMCEKTCYKPQTCVHESCTLFFCSILFNINIDCSKNSPTGIAEVSPVVCATVIMLNDRRLYLQVFDLEACRKAVPSELSDVIIAQVQGFHRN